MNVREVADRIYMQLDEIGVFPEPVELADWDGDGYPEIHGWSLPTYSEGDGFFARFCPELIANTIKNVKPGDQDDYITALLATLMLHVTVHDESLSDYERIALVENRLGDKALGSLRLLSDVELNTLDNR